MGRITQNLRLPAGKNHKSPPKGILPCPPEPHTYSEVTDESAQMKNLNGNPQEPERWDNNSTNASPSPSLAPAGICTGTITEVHHHQPE